MRKFLLLSLLFVTTFELSARIVVTRHIRTVLTELRKINKSKKVLVAFDVDETLVVPDNDNHRGGDMWLQARVQHAISKGVAVKTAWDIMLPMYFEIQKDPSFSLRLVEGKETKAVIEEIQKAANKTIGLTARSFPIEDDTIRLLEQTGLRFVKSGWFKKFGDHDKVFMFDGVPGGFKHGIFFCGSGDKGESLMKLFGGCEYKPDAVVFADDKMKNIKAVEKYVEAAGMEFIGIHYTYLEEAKKNYKLHPDLT